MVYNSKFLESANSMENFFFDTVNEIRKSIAVRKKIRECSLEEFRKEDKLELLIRILSNDEILVYLHEKIFGRKSDNNPETGSQNVIIPDGNKKKGQSFHISANSPLPNIKSGKSKNDL